MGALPNGFDELEMFLPEWGLATEAERFEKRISRSMDDMRPFYQAILPRMPEVYERLKSGSLAEFSVEEENLLRLGLSYIEISRAFEVWNQPDVRADFFAPDRLHSNG